MNCFTQVLHCIVFWGEGNVYKLSWQKMTSTFAVFILIIFITVNPDLVCLRN